MYGLWHIECSFGRGDQGFFNCLRLIVHYGREVMHMMAFTKDNKMGEPQLNSAFSDCGKDAFCGKEAGQSEGQVCRLSRRTPGLFQISPGC